MLGHLSTIIYMSALSSKSKQLRSLKKFGAVYHSLGLLFGLLITVSIFLCLSTAVQAQNFDIASTYELADPDVVPGDIITSSNQDLIRAENPYDNQLFGIVQDNAVLIFTEASGSGRPIVRNGDAVVRVTDYNGQIQIGDRITSSVIKGYGMKATQSGYVIGAATGEFKPDQIITFQNKQVQTGTIQVALKIEYAELTTARSANRYLEYFGAAFFRNIQDPDRFTSVMKSIIAGLIAIASFATGFFAFTKAISKGVEAIGRNPLAKRAIQIAIVIQLVLTIFTTIAGLVGAFIVLRL